MTGIPSAGVLRMDCGRSKSLVEGLLLAVISLLTACGGSNSSPAPQLVSIAVTPATATVGVGSMQQFTATGTYTDKSTKDLTSAAVWSTASNVASISNLAASQGLATVIGAGFTTITASLGGVTSPAAVLATPEYAYVANSGDGAVAEFSIGTTGALALMGRVGAVGTSSVAVEPSGHYAYAGGGAISEFSIGTDGTLTLIGKTTNGSGSPSWVTVDPTSRYVYGADFSAGTVSEFSIGSGGLLTLIGTVTVANGIHSEVPFVTVDPTGHYAYATAYIDGTISEFSIGPDGALTLIGTVMSGSGSTSNPNCIAVDPTGHYAYVTNYGAGTVSAFSIGTTGGLTLIGTVVSGSGAPSSTVPVGSEPISVAVDRAGHYVYVANQIDGTVSEFSIGTTGALAPIGDVVTGTGPHSFPLSVAVDATNRYAYVANGGEGTVSAFSIGTDGALALIDSVMTGTGALSGPSSIATTF